MLSLNPREEPSRYIATVLLSASAPTTIHSVTLPRLPPARGKGGLGGGWFLLSIFKVCHEKHALSQGPSEREAGPPWAFAVFVLGDRVAIALAKKARS